MSIPGEAFSHINRLKPEWFTRGGRAPAPERAARVLVVDDEPGVRLGFRLALEAVGHEVSEAGDGAEALDRLGRGPFDVVLLDLRMPRLDGLGALCRLRGEGSEVPVVIVTAAGRVEDVAEAVALGVADVLAKPVTPAALRRAVSGAFARREEFGTGAVSDLDPAVTELESLLGRARRALHRRDLDEAESLVRRALELDPSSPEAHALRGIVHEGFDEPHTAYRSYRRALTIDPRHSLALRLMEAYCHRFGIDPNNPRINPAAGI
jgi:CheY-like chemotaxis protein